MEQTAHTTIVRPTLDPSQHMIAVIVEALETTDEVIADADKEHFLVTLAATWPTARAAFTDFVRLEERLAALSSIERGTTGHGAVCMCGLFHELDDLLAMAEPSGFADAGELLDPDGSLHPLLDHLAVIATMRAEQGHAQCTPRRVAWLVREARHEKRDRRVARRQREKAVRWPWNATGTMGRVGAARYDLRGGHLSHLERTFRMAMVKARALLANESGRGAGDGDGGGDRNLASAIGVLEGLAGQGARLPRRMRGLVCAGIARIRLLALPHDTRHPTRRDTAREPAGLATIKGQIAEARRLLFPHGRGVAEDIVGTARLHADLAALSEWVPEKLGDRAAGPNAARNPGAIGGVDGCR